HRELTAGLVFEDGLKENEKMYVQFSMSNWIDTGRDFDKRNHGFKSGQAHRELYVFKKDNNRFYGFLCHPLPRNEPRLLLCVLCIHAFKNERDTDQAELGRVENWFHSPAAQKAISVVYCDDP